MRKTIISSALATVALFAVSSVSAQSCDNNDGKNVEKCDGQKMERPQAVNPFENLNLTEAQQNSLKALAEEQKAQCKEKADGEKADRQKEAKERMDAIMDAMKNQRTEYLAKIKAILTPEQYVQFLENNYVNQLGMEPGRPGMQPKAKGPGQRRDRGNGPERGQNV